MTFVINFRGKAIEAGIVLALPLNLATAQWVAEAFLRSTADHPLQDSIPKGRFGYAAINTLRWPWRVTFSRRRSPAVLSAGGRPIEVCPSDRVEFSLDLIPSQVVDVRPPRKTKPVE